MRDRGEALTAALAHARPHFVTKTGYAVDDDDFQVDTFDEIFSSTSGPFGGVGGQMFTSMSVQVLYHNPTGEAVVYCGGHPLRQVDHHEWRRVVDARQVRPR